VNKSEVLRAVALRERITFAEAERTVDAFLEVISLSLACEEDVSIRNFGKFEHRTRRPVTRNNPRTGVPVDVPQRHTVGFKPAPRLKDRVNGVR
jgi:DNA-binding protein HU-beta